MAFEAPLDQTKMGVAILAACIVQTLGESDTTLQKRFLDRLKMAYGEVHDQADTDCLETLIWTREMLQSGDFSPRRDS